MSKFKNMKFLVANTQESEKLQEVLFDLGYAWGRSEQNFQFTGADAIFTYLGGEITVLYNAPHIFYKESGGHIWMNTAEFIAQHSPPEPPKFLEDAYDSPKSGGRVVSVTEAIELIKGAGGELMRKDVEKGVYTTEPIEDKPVRNKYMREIKPGVWVDVYSVLQAFNVVDPCLQHLVKKALAVGQRGHKDATTDYKDIYDSAKRAVELHTEWNS